MGNGNEVDRIHLDSSEAFVMASSEFSVLKFDSVLPSIRA